MLTNRNLNFDADGFALLVEDIRRLSKHVFGGSNDLNANAVAVDQLTQNDISSALDEHVAAADPHPQYQLLDDVVTADTNAYGLVAIRGSSQAVSSGTGSYDIVCNSIVRDDSGLYSTLTGYYTAPVDGWYTASVTTVYSASSGSGTINAAITVGGAPVYFGSWLSITTFGIVTATVSVYLTAGQTLRPRFDTTVSVGTSVLTTGTHFSVVKSGD